MITRDALARHVDTLLGCSRFADYAPNGLQVEGKANISRICTATTASAEAIGQAAACGADALLVHHGWFWRGEPPVITGMKAARIRALMAADISLFAWHLPLDCHPELGNNAKLAALLGILEPTLHAAGGTEGLLWCGALQSPLPPAEFAALLEHRLGRKPLWISGNGHPVSRIAWCTGAAQDFLADAKALEADAYLSGEVSERTWYEARELGIHYYACGHHATERFGIRALGDHLAEAFSLDHQFIDSENPV